MAVAGGHPHGYFLDRQAVAQRFPVRQNDGEGDVAVFQLHCCSVNGQIGHTDLWRTWECPVSGGGFATCIIPCMTLKDEIERVQKVIKIQKKLVASADRFGNGYRRLGA